MKLMDNYGVDALSAELERLSILLRSEKMQLNKTERCQNKPNYKIKNLLPLEENKTD